MLTVLAFAQQSGSTGQTRTVQQGFSFDMSVTRKQAFAPGATFPIFTVIEVD
jgi:hypothetical protein